MKTSEELRAPDLSISRSKSAAQLYLTGSFQGGSTLYSIAKKRSRDKYQMMLTRSGKGKFMPDEGYSRFIRMDRINPYKLHRYWGISVIIQHNPAYYKEEIRNKSIGATIRPKFRLDLLDHKVPHAEVISWKGALSTCWGISVNRAVNELMG